MIRGQKIVASCFTSTFSGADNELKGRHIVLRQTKPGDPKPTAADKVEEMKEMQSSPGDDSPSRAQVKVSSTPKLQRI